MRKPKDWGQPCPNPDCSHYRLINRGNISAISTYLTQSGRRRIFRCSACEQPFSETRDTVFFNLRSPEEKVMMALKMLLVKVALSDIGFVLGVAEATVLECCGAPHSRLNRSMHTSCGTCPSPRCNSMRCGTSAGANMPS